MPFTIAHSPDSDDAYMMAPLALGWLDPEGFDFRFVRKDIETLNAEALEGRYEVTAISFGAYPELADSYELLTAGSSIQEGTGPLVVARDRHDPGRTCAASPWPSPACAPAPTWPCASGCRT